MEIYISKADGQTGPFDLNRVMEGLRTSEFLPDDLYWHEGMESWQPLNTLGKTKPPEPPPHPPSAQPKVAADSGGFEFGNLPPIVRLVLVGAVIAWIFYPSQRSQDKESSDKSLPEKYGSTQPKVVTLGSTKGAYTKMTMLKLASNMLELGAQHQKVEVSYTLATLIVTPSMFRINLCPMDRDAEGIYVTLEQNHPLYNKIIDLAPPNGTKITLWGTVRNWANRFDSVHIEPDQIVFHLR